jgi:putative redox protein
MIDEEKPAPPPLTATLTWEGEKRFTATDGAGFSLSLNSDGNGVTPTEAALMGVGGCMAIDVLSILEKQRQTVTSMRVEVKGDRNAEPPKFYTAIAMTFHVAGPDLHGPKIEKAIELSTEKYCSVLHTFRPDIKWDIGYEID